MPRVYGDAGSKGRTRMIPDHWNSAEKLPPVACPLLIRVPGGAVLPVERLSHVASRGDMMAYVFADVFIFEGRFEWSYP